jgi:hypothetical protein
LTNGSGYARILTVRKTKKPGENKMKITKMWVAVVPNPDSTLEDVLYEVTIKDLMNQFRGGLDVDEILGLYTTEIEAYERVSEAFEELDDDMVNGYRE